MYRNVGHSDNYFTVDPSSGDVSLATGVRAIDAAGAGNVVVTRRDGVDVTLSFAAGQLRPISAVAIKQAGTTATGIVVYY